MVNLLREKRAFVTRAFSAAIVNRPLEKKKITSRGLSILRLQYVQFLPRDKVAIYRRRVKAVVTSRNTILKYQRLYRGCSKAPFSPSLYLFQGKKNL